MEKVVKIVGTAIIALVVVISYDSVKTLMKGKSNG